MAAFPGRDGQLALNGEVANPDRSGLRQLVAGGEVRWSADGMRIVFVCEAGGIAVAKADGSDVRVLSTEPSDRNPAWSPDGRWIAFSGAGDGAPEIFAMRTDGSERRQLTFFDPDVMVFRVAPVWSPDGNTIAYVQHQATCFSTIAGVHPDGSPATVPVAVEESDELIEPEWAPSGAGVALVRTNQCSHRPGADVFGPDGRLLASFNPGVCEISETCLWSVNRAPAVSPDGQHVAYVKTPLSGSSESAGVHIVDVDGSDDRLALAVPAADKLFSHVDWRPLPTAAPAGVCAEPRAAADPVAICSSRGLTHSWRSTLQAVVAREHWLLTRD